MDHDHKRYSSNISGNGVSNEQAIGGRRTLIWLIAMLLGMVIFTLALIPLYRVFCDVFGINGKIALEAKQVSDLIKVSDRQVDLQFVTQIGSGLPVSFKAQSILQTVNLGSRQTTDFVFKNLANKDVIIRAVPSVSPAEASRYLLKMECFCFQELTLKSQQTLTIPLLYFVSANIPEHVKTITLSYQLYPVNQPTG